MCKNWVTWDFETFGARRHVSIACDSRDHIDQDDLSSGTPPRCLDLHTYTLYMLVAFWVLFHFLFVPFAPSPFSLCFYFLHCRWRFLLLVVTISDGFFHWFALEVVTVSFTKLFGMVITYISFRHRRLFILAFTCLLRGFNGTLIAFDCALLWQWLSTYNYCLAFMNLKG